MTPCGYAYVSNYSTIWFMDADGAWTPPDDGPFKGYQALSYCYGGSHMEPRDSQHWWMSTIPAALKDDQIVKNPLMSRDMIVTRKIPCGVPKRYGFRLSGYGELNLHPVDGWFECELRYLTKTPRPDPTGCATHYLKNLDPNLVIDIDGGGWHTSDINKMLIQWS